MAKVEGVAQRSAGPPWANADVSCLYSMLAARLRMGTPNYHL